MDGLSVLAKQQTTNKGRMNKETSNDLTAAQQAELKALAALSEDQIETNHIPEIQDWSGAKRGVFYRHIKSKI
ncbi:MAG: hypothetical protein KME35_03375 [Aphanocapsa sp. GSE-SYN-MK-11-07L]|nr:hypothetical protein [Aphanocapsa sp. GSE-SYN-MK-11-07L]